MGRACLHILILLVPLVATVTRPGGEICHYWMRGVESPAGTFQCPELEKWDNVDAIFCCGTCHVPYCCSSAEARLEQDWCLGGNQLMVSSVPRATHPPPTSFYIGVGLTAASLLGVAAFFIYVKICLPLRARLRARRQVHQQEMPPLRVSFRDPSPAFAHGLGSGLQGPHPPSLYHALSMPLPHASSPPPRAERLDESGQVASALPRDDEAGSSPAAALLDTAASSGTPEPKE